MISTSSAAAASAMRIIGSAKMCPYQGPASPEVLPEGNIEQQDDAKHDSAQYNIPLTPTRACCRFLLERSPIPGESPHARIRRPGQQAERYHHRCGDDEQKLGVVEPMNAPE